MRCDSALPFSGAQEGYEAAMACDGEQCDGQTLKVQKCKWSPKERAARLRQRAQQGAAQQAEQPQQAPRQQQQQQQQQQAPAPAPAPAQDGGFGALLRQQAEAGGRRQYQSPAPKTEGYNVAYVGERGHGMLHWLL
jgi:hypothetical protein